MLCEEERLLSAVEIVNTIIEQFLHLHVHQIDDLDKKLQIEFFLDCDGAGGQYLAFVEALEK